MSLTERYTSRPPIVTGDDGLPHCGWCLNEHVLCTWHKNQVRTMLDHLVTANTLGRSQTDLRYIIAKTPVGYGTEADA